MKDYKDTKTSELLLIVDRSNPEVRALAERIETILELNRDYGVRMETMVKEAIHEAQSA